jgi:phage gp29-like protein
VILDADGNPIDLAAIREPQTAKVAHLATEFESHPARGLTPQRLHSIMCDAEVGNLLRQLDLAEDIEERDGHCFAEIDKRKGAVASLEWNIVEPPNASAAEKKVTDQVREWIQALPDFEDVVRGMMDAVLKGFSCQELVWSLEERVLLPKITFRPQRWITVDRATRNELRLRDIGSSEGQPLQPFSWIAHMHRSRNGYLARGGLARVLAWPYIFKHYAIRDLAEFLEIYGLPLRLGSYPSGASQEEKRTLLRAVGEIGHNAAGIIPQGMKIDFQSAAVGSEVPFAAMWDRMDAVQSKVILGQTLTASEGRNGTQALGKVHNEVRMDIRNADARQVEGTLKRQLIHPLAVLNIPGADPKRLPGIQFETREAEDLKLYADALPKLAASGVQIPVKWANDMLRIPEPAEGEAVLKGPQPPANLQPGAAKEDPPEPPPKKKAALATELPAAPPRDAIDELVDEQLAGWRPLLAPLVQPLLAELDKAVAQGESLAAFAARLPQLVQRMDSRPLADGLARAAFPARLAGEADLDLQPEQE